MRLNEAGKMVDFWWRETARHFPSVEIDQYVVMPNHLHGILIIHMGGHIGPPLRDGSAKGDDLGTHTGPPLRDVSIGSPLASVIDVIQWFKTMTTNAYIRAVNQHGWPRFDGKLWQRGFHDHVIRTEEDLNRIRAYILYNPSQWRADAENPTRHSSAL